MKIKRVWVLFAILLILIFVSLFFNCSSLISICPSKVTLWIDQLSQIHPFFIILLITILPLFGFPISPLYIASGVIYGILLGLLLSFIGSALNIAIGYWIAKSLFRKPFLRLMSKKKYGDLTIGKNDQNGVIFLVRILPGIPIWAQNYLLGLLKVSFKNYFLISLPIQMIWCILFVITSGAIYQNNISLAIIMALSFFTTYIIIKKFRKKFKKKK